MGDRQSSHAHHRIHGRADIVAHGGKEVALRPVCLFREGQGVFQRLLGLPLGSQRIRHVCPHQAYRRVIDIAPHDGDLFVPLPLIRMVRKKEIVSVRLLPKAFQNRMDAESGADFRLIFLGDALVDKSQNRLLIALGIGGRKIFQNRRPRVHGKTPAGQIDKSGQFKGISDQTQHSLLLPDRIRNIRSRKTDSSKSEVDRGQSYTFCADIPVLIHKGEGEGIRP